MVIAIFFNAITEMTTTQENIMELLDMRDDCLIDEWADYEDYDYADDAVELQLNGIKMRFLTRTRSPLKHLV